MMFRRLCSENVNHSIAFVNGCSFSRRTCFKYVSPLAFFLDIVVSLTKMKQTESRLRVIKRRPRICCSCSMARRYVRVLGRRGPGKPLSADLLINLKLEVAHDYHDIVS